MSSWEPNLKPGGVIQSWVEVGRVFQLLRKNSDRLDVKRDPIITDIMYRDRSKIFISSRPDGDMKDKFKSRMNIEIQATDNHDDISIFVKREIAKHRRWSKIVSEL